MSILMDALKQQTSSQPAAADGSAFWRKLALLLALLVAMLSGALLAYWLQPARLPAQHTAEVITVPARPADILAVLQQAAVPEQAGQAEAVVAEPVVVAARESLPEAKPVKTVTVPDISAAEPEPEAAVSDELRDKFSQALKATAQQDDRTPAIRTHNAPAQDISTLDSSMLRQIPPLRFDAHVYATSVSQRWVKVNGKTLQEGQWVTADIRIREITPQYVLLELGNQLFSMAALSEWPAG